MEFLSSIFREAVADVQPFLSSFSCAINPDYPMHVDRISMELQILNFNGTQVDICFICAYSADPDEISPYAAFTVCQSTCLSVSRIKNGKRAIHVKPFTCLFFGHTCRLVFKVFIITLTSY